MHQTELAQSAQHVLGNGKADLGHGVLLGLDLMAAADIVGTVAVAPGFASLGVLAPVIPSGLF